MREKKIILCEGKHDSCFLRHIFNKLEIEESRYKIFDQSSQNTIEQTKHKDTVILKSFGEKSSPYATLVKSESGKDKAKKLFVFYFNDFVCYNKKAILLLDADNCLINAKANELRKAILTNQRGAGLELEEHHKFEDKHFNLIEFSVKGELDNKLIFKFYLVLVCPVDLEHTLGLQEKDNEQEINKKIAKYLETHDKPVELFRSLLSNQSNL